MISGQVCNFLFFMIFENFQHFGTQDLRSGSDLGIFEILDQKMCRVRDLYRGYDPLGGRGH